MPLPNIFHPQLASTLHKIIPYGDIIRQADTLREEIHTGEGRHTILGDHWMRSYVKAKGFHYDEASSQNLPIGGGLNTAATLDPNFHLPTWNQKQFSLAHSPRHNMLHNLMGYAYLHFCIDETRIEHPRAKIFMSMMTHPCMSPEERRATEIAQIFAAEFLLPTDAILKEVTTSQKIPLEALSRDFLSPFGDSWSSKSEPCTPAEEGVAFWKSLCLKVHETAHPHMLYARAGSSIHNLMFQRALLTFQSRFPITV